MATLLIVDDSMSNRQLVDTVMRYHGYRTLQARDAAQALVVLKAEPVDVVLADIMMPDTDGYQLAQAIRSDPALRGLPVIFYTANYQAAGIREKADEAGVSSIVPKTGDLSALLASVHDAIRAAG